MSQVAHQAGAYPGFCSMKRLLPLDGMLVHPWLPPALNLLVPIYTPEWRGTVRVECLAREHNTMSLARARTWTAQSGVECTNHEATTHCILVVKCS